MSATANGDGVAITLPPELIEAVAARVAEMLAERQRPAEHEMLTVGEAAELLCCRRQRLYDLSSQGKLPCLRDGSRLLFRRSELVSYLEGGER